MENDGHGALAKLIGHCGACKGRVLGSGLTCYTPDETDQADREMTNWLT